MILKVCQKKYCFLTKKFFDFSRLDPLYDEKILTALFGNKWSSVLIYENKRAFLHVYIKKKIPHTSYFDIDPFFGYGGPICNTKNQTFIEKALEKYIQFQKSKKIIGEIIRFHPLLRNNELFEGSKKLILFDSKDLIITNCFKNKKKQFSEYSTLRKRNIKKAQDIYGFKQMRTTKEWKTWIELYKRTMDRRLALKKWYFDHKFYSRLKKCSAFRLFAVTHKNQIVATALFIQNKFLSHYFLVGNPAKFYKGASEYLIYKVSLDFAKKGMDRLLLGGGVINAPNDSLFEFKRKFTKSDPVKYWIGKITFNQSIINKLNKIAEETNPKLIKLNYFLKYRLTNKYAS